MASTIYIILVEPKNPGNIGAVARAMHNYGLKYLRLVNPCPLDEDARRRAMHGLHILEKAKIYTTIESATKELGLLIGTSGKIAKTDKDVLRVPIRPRELAQQLPKLRGKIGIMFGREDIGLLNDELALCDIFVNIPAMENASILNLSHAAIIIFYELYLNSKAKAFKTHRINAVEKQKMFEYLGILLDEIKFPAHKRKGFLIMFRRFLGRNYATRWDNLALLGLFHRTVEELRHRKSET